MMDYFEDERGESFGIESNDPEGLTPAITLYISQGFRDSSFHFLSLDQAEDMALNILTRVRDLRRAQDEQNRERLIQQAQTGA